MGKTTPSCSKTTAISPLRILPQCRVAAPEANCDDKRSHSISGSDEAPFLHKLMRGVETHWPRTHASVRVSARFRSAPAGSQSDRHELVFLVLTSLTMLVGPWCTSHHLVRAPLARGAPVASTSLVSFVYTPALAVAD